MTDGSPDIISPQACLAVVSERLPRLVGIDGLPVAGKSTLVERMVEAFGADVIWLDDFVRPEAEWRGSAEAGFPFSYMRYAEFVDSIEQVHRTGSARYRPYDWAAGGPAAEEKTVGGDRMVIVEGVSALGPGLAPLYDLRIWVESDRESVLDAALARGAGTWAEDWRTLFLPSVAHYLETDPKSRADLCVRGRGID